MGYSLPNHTYTVAGQSGGLIVNVPNLKALEEAMDDPDGFSFASVVDLMSTSEVSWKYYVEAQPAPEGVPMTLSETGLRLAFPNPQQFSLWNPLPGFKKIRDNPAQMAHLADLKDYFRDLRERTLPAVSWIIPDYQDSEHPIASPQDGMWYVTKLVNALMAGTVRGRSEAPRWRWPLDDAAMHWASRDSCASSRRASRCDARWARAV